MDEFFDRMERLYIECELPDGHRSRFSTRYRDATGELPDPQFLLSQNNKFGVEYRMYFDADDEVFAALEDAGFNIEARSSGYRSDRAFRINSEKLFWELINRGRRLGEN